MNEEEKLAFADEFVEVLDDCDEDIVIYHDTEKTEKAKRTILNRTNVSIIMINAITDALGEEAPIFLDRCNSFSKFADMIVFCFDKLDYRERAMIAAKLGFDMNSFAPKPKEYYIDIATDHELSSPQTPSRIIKRALRKIAEKMVFSAEEVYRDAGL